MNKQNASEKNRIVLGLDVGIASVGWSLIEIKEKQIESNKKEQKAYDKYETVGYKIIDMGVRTFFTDSSEQAGKKSPAKIRGEARRLRRTIKRKARRKNELRNKLIQYGFIERKLGKKEFLKEYFENPEDSQKINNSWFLRTKALEEKLTNKELVKVIYHIVNHRGFYFASKSETASDDKEVGKVKSSIQALKNLAGEELTIAQAIFKDNKDHANNKNNPHEYRMTNKTRKSKKKSSNTSPEYKYCIPRELLKKELETILNTQKKLGNHLINDEFKEEIIENILMFQKGYDSEKSLRLWGKCEAFKDELRAPKESYHSQYFTILNEINNIKFRTTKNTKKENIIELPSETKEALASEIVNNPKKYTFKHVREFITKNFPEQIDESYEFNKCTYQEDVEETKKLNFIIKDNKLEIANNTKETIDTVLSTPDEGETLNDEQIEKLKKEVQRRSKSKNKSDNKEISAKISYKRIRQVTEIGSDFKFKDLKYPPLDDNRKKWLNYYENKSTLFEHKGLLNIKKALGDESWRKLIKDEEGHDKIDKIADILSKEKEDAPRTQQLKEHIPELTEAAINELLVLSFKGVANYSIKALKIFIKYMKTGMMQYEAKEKAEENNEIPKKDLFEKAKEEFLKPYIGDFSNNPVVARSFAQTRKVINAINRKYKDEYGGIDQIKIEVATQIANSKAQRDKIRKNQNTNKQRNENAKNTLKQHNIPHTTKNIRKLRLYYEQEEKCIYTGQSIDLGNKANMLNFRNCEIDHIIPQSEVINNSMANVVLVAGKANQEKGKNIPKDYFMNKDPSGKQWEEFLKNLKTFKYLTYKKRQNLQLESFNAEDQEEFISKNLNDTRYVSRKIAEYLREYYKFSDRRNDINKKSRITVSSGGITGLMRHRWGLSRLKNRDKDDTHHAIDATVVALTSFGHIWQLSNEASKKIKKHNKTKDIFTEKKTSLRNALKEKLACMNVSRAPRKTISSPTNEDTIYKIKKDVDLSKMTRRVLKLRGGYAELGTIVRTDIFTDKKGKNYMVPLYLQDFNSKEGLPSKAIKSNTPYDEWIDVSDPNEYEFRFSLYKDDLIKITEKEKVTKTKKEKEVETNKKTPKPIKENFYYIEFTEGINPKIKVKGFKNLPSINTHTITNKGLEKYEIDILGRIRKVKKEKRLGTIS